jgi:hypothetical protein
MGSLKIKTNVESVATDCVLFGHAFPCWLFVINELQLEPQAVFLEKVTYVEAVRALVPTSCQIRVGDDSDVCLPALGRNTIGLVDGSFTGELTHFLSKWNISRVVYTGQQRRSIAQWNNTSVSLRHARLGGVTLGNVQIGGSFRHKAPRVRAIADIAPHDASTVLSVKGVVHQYRRAPKHRHTPNFECENLGTPKHPIYHGGGWLPAWLNRTTQIMTPHIYAGTGSWVSRPLSWNKVLVCYDAPNCVVEALEPHQQMLDAAFFAGLVAGKCLTMGFLCVNGGR